MADDFQAQLDEAMAFHNAKRLILKLCFQNDFLVDEKAVFAIAKLIVAEYQPKPKIAYADAPFDPLAREG